MKKLICLLLASLFVFNTIQIEPCTADVDPNSKGPSQTNIHQCECIKDYIFKPTIHKCVRDCNLFKDALSNCKQPRTDLNVCVCKDNFDWTDSIKNCARKCTLDTNTQSSYDPTKIDQCLCLNNFQWSLTQQKCVCDSTVGYYTPTDGTFANQCAADCRNLQNSPKTNKDINTCDCTDSTFIYVPNSLSPPGRCERDCSSIQNTNGIQQTDVAKCKCLTGYEWQYQYTAKCAINCAKDPNADSTKGSNGNIDADSCNCKSGFIWFSKTDIVGTNLLYPQCVRDCRVTTDSKSTGKFKSTDITQCECVANYYWETTQTNYANKCVHKCQGTHELPTHETVDKCNCRIGYAWNVTLGTCGCWPGYINNTVTNKCENPCGTPNVPLSKLPTNGDTYPLVCQCVSTNLQWNPTKFVCNCAASSQAYNPNSDKCENPCSSISDQNIKGTLSVNPLICDCYYPFKWVEQNYCRLDCTKDPNSLQQLSTGYHFSYQKCKCKQGYTPTLNQGSQTLCQNPCQSIPNAINKTYLLLHYSYCKCNSNYAYNLGSQSCSQVDCNLYRNVNINTPSNDPIKCTCNSNYAWDSYNIGCSNNLCINEFVSYDPYQCTCQSYQIWNTTLQKCVLNCKNDQNSTGYYDMFHNYFCQCKYGYVPVGINSVCINPCVDNKVLHAIGTLYYMSKVICICQDKYIWNTINKMCKINCKVISYATDIGSNTLCGCQNNYQWDGFSSCVPARRLLQIDVHDEDKVQGKQEKI